MAARLNPKHDDATRAKIQTSQLINRLNAFAMGAKDPQSETPVEMTDTQVRAALGLLRKVLPDLAMVEQQIEDNRQRVVGSDPLSDDDWERKYGNSLDAPGGAAESTH